MTNYAGGISMRDPARQFRGHRGRGPRELKENATVRDVCPRIVRRNNYDGIDCIKRTEGTYGEYSERVSGADPAFARRHQESRRTKSKSSVRDSGRSDQRSQHSLRTL